MKQLELAAPRKKRSRNVKRPLFLAVRRDVKASKETKTYSATTTAYRFGIGVSTLNDILRAKNWPDYCKRKQHNLDRRAQSQRQQDIKAGEASHSSWQDAVLTRDQQPSAAPIAPERTVPVETLDKAMKALGYRDDAEHELGLVIRNQSRTISRLTWVAIGGCVATLGFLAALALWIIGVVR